jgi:hypothetical protein
MLFPELDFVDVPSDRGRGKVVYGEVVVKENGATMAEFFAGKNPSTKDIQALGGFWSSIDEVYIFPDHSTGKFEQEGRDVRFVLVSTE